MRLSGKRCKKCLWMAELHETSFLGSSLKNESDATLFLELALRGHDLSKLRDEETTAEIIKLA